MSFKLAQVPADVRHSRKETMGGSHHWYDQEHTKDEVLPDISKLVWQYKHQAMRRDTAPIPVPDPSQPLFEKRRHMHRMYGRMGPKGKSAEGARSREEAGKEGQGRR